ncbi:MAG: glycosyl hydrolase family 43 [Ruminococcaceae bacterium]|nr:glycosyl hydrolase family 43 [Oscillospiraceae bacterium]
MKKFLFVSLLLSCFTLLASCNPPEAYEHLSTSAETDSQIPTDAPTEVPTEIPTEIHTEAPTETPTEEDTTVNIIYETVQNPIHDGGGDPWVVEKDGKYYYCYSIGNGVSVAEVSSIHQLVMRGRRVYAAPSGTAYSSEYWAPELHYINGEWYIYVAADDGDNYHHRMYVLKGTTQNPLDPFEMVGQITDPSNKWAIDGTVMELDGELYFIWSGWEGNVNVAQNIYIAHMSDPCTIDSERVCLSIPDRSWEQHGEPHVNEGPAVLQHDGKTFLVYSASGSWTDQYCLGMLTLTGDNPMDPQSWEKSSRSVFKKVSKVAYGPGHCSFSTACDGSIWMIYHANLVSGSGWSGRSVWIAPVTFEEDGSPNFGRPTREVQFPVDIKP